MSKRLILIISVLAAPAAMPAAAFDLERSLKELHPQYRLELADDAGIAQRGNGMTLSQAIASVRRQTNGRVISANTRRSGDREVHHIKVLTEDGKVRTYRIPGRKLR